MKNPNTITIAIPVLNGAKYIRKAIESALEQSQKADEILIINNNSSDKTWSICETYVELKSKLFPIIQNKDT